MKSGRISNLKMDPYLLAALREDVTSEDVTTASILTRPQAGEVDLIAKADGVLCGLDVFSRVFVLLDDEAIFVTSFQDGDVVTAGTKVGEVHGDVRALLTGERTALNFLQRMSGIATNTRRYVDALSGSPTKLLDTRKTTPNLRLFEKYAVAVGGGVNHRYNLSDGVLIKDNHIDAAGSIAQAVAMARAHAPFVRKIEVETETLDEVEEALEAGADIIMLDNMDTQTMAEAVRRIGSRAQTECSGNVTLERLAEIAAIGVDFVSSGAVVYNAPVMDLSMKHLRVVD